MSNPDANSMKMKTKGGVTIFYHGYVGYMYTKRTR